MSDEINIGEGSELPGENGDRKYVVNGRAWRARLRTIELPTTAPVSGPPTAVVPAKYGIKLSVALLDEADQVAADAGGRLIVFDPTVLTWQAEALQHPVFDPEAEIRAAIAERILAGEAQLAGRERVQAALAAWPQPAPDREEGAAIAAATEPGSDVRTEQAPSR